MSISSQFILFNLFKPNTLSILKTNVSHTEIRFIQVSLYISFLFQTAIDIAEGLLDENDEVPQVWYLIGWANYLMGEDFKGNARFYLNKCKKVKSENLMHQQKIVRLLILYYHFDQQTILPFLFCYNDKLYYPWLNTNVGC